MLSKLKNKIAANRGRKNIFWQSFLAVKDTAWFFYQIIFYYLLSLRYRRIKKFQRAPKEKVKVLYLSDHPDGSITHLANIWLVDNPALDLTVKYSEREKISQKDFRDYDLVVFPIAGQYFNYLYDPRKSMVIVHDLAELYAGRENDFINRAASYERKFFLQVLRKLKNILVVSREMQKILAEQGINAHLLSTMGRFPLRDKNQIITKKCSVCSVGSESWRKNPGLLFELEKHFAGRINFNLKIGFKILDDEKYLQLIDNNEIYLCTSFVEGGPLPALEAMGRGAVVLTTPVGQMPELIVDGENGFICRNKEEFIGKIELLNADFGLLQDMRKKSRETIESRRNMGDLKREAGEFIKDCYLRS